MTGSKNETNILKMLKCCDCGIDIPERNVLIHQAHGCKGRGRRLEAAKRTADSTTEITTSTNYNAKRKATGSGGEGGGEKEETTSRLRGPRNSKSQKGFQMRGNQPMNDHVVVPDEEEQLTVLCNPQQLQAKKVVCSECGCRVRQKNMMRHLEISCSKRVPRALIVESNQSSRGSSSSRASDARVGGASPQSRCWSKQRALIDDKDTKVSLDCGDEICVDTLKANGKLSNASSSPPPPPPAATEARGVVDLCSDDDDDDDESFPNQKSIHDDDDGDEITNNKDLRRVYDEVDISSKTSRQLKKLGINTLTDLLGKMEELKTGALVDVKRQTQKRLYTFCVWYQDFYAEHASHVPWQGCFDEDDNLLEEFEQEIQLTDSTSMSELAIPILFDHAVNVLHEPSMGNLNSLTAHHYEALYEYATNRVYNNMSAELRERCHFPIESFAYKIIEAIFNLPSGKSSGKAFLVYGRTQAGKTAFNALMVVISETLDCLLLSITKGVSESDDLRDKMKGYLSNSKTARDNRFRHFGTKKKGEAWVTADTYKRIGEAAQDMQERRIVKPSGKFWVVLDEADTIYRTAEREQRMEKALDSLLGLGPCVKILLSATSVPSIIGTLEDGGTEEVEILKVGTAADYFGINEMRPLKDEEGHCVFLDNKEVSQKNGVGYKHAVELAMQPHDKKKLFDREGKADIDAKPRFPARLGRIRFIPYTSRKVLRMFDVALAKDGKKGKLILDCTATLVNVGLTVFHKAACLQNHYYQQGKPMIAIVFIGQEIHFRRPGFSRSRFVSSKKKTIQQVLQKLDEEFGLSMPVAVFGYIKMRRCISFRSNLRVPTHMILRLGKGHSNESFVQALGRGTGNFKSVLKENGYECVTLLTNRNDFLMATKYENFCPEVQQRHQEGISLQEAFKGGDRRFPNSANFLQHSIRKVGQRKDFRDQCPGPDAFDFELDENWTCVIMQGVLRAMRDLVQEDGKHSFTLIDIEKKFNDTYQLSDIGITKHQLTTVVRSLCENNALQQHGADEGGLKHYAVKDGADFGSFINPDLNYRFVRASGER